MTRFILLMILFSISLFAKADTIAPGDSQKVEICIYNDWNGYNNESVSKQNEVKNNESMGYQVIKNYCKKAFYLIIILFVIVAMLFYLSFGKIASFLKKNPKEGTSKDDQSYSSSDDINSNIEKLLGSLDEEVGTGKVKEVFDDIKEQIKTLVQKELDLKSVIDQRNNDIEKLEQNLKDAVDKCNNKITEAVRSKDDELKNAKEKLKSYDSEMNKLKGTHTKEINGLKTTHCNELQTARREFEQALNNQKRSCDNVMGNLNSQHAQEMAGEQAKTKEYRAQVTFAITPFEKCQDYVSKILKALDLMDEVERRAYDMSKRGLSNDNVIYYFNKGFTKYNCSIKASKVELAVWRGELSVFMATGLYKVVDGSKLKGVLEGMQNADEQLNNLVYRLHDAFMSEFCSASLILCQELSKLDELSGGKVDAADVIFFSKAYTELQTIIKQLGYITHIVQLFIPFDSSLGVKAVSFSDVKDFASNTIVEVLHVGVNYGGSKKTTDVVIIN